MSQESRAYPHPLCEHLCSKHMMMTADDPERILDDLQKARMDTYWCERTRTDTGPDGGWVIFDRCAPGRECFAPRPTHSG